MDSPVITLSRTSSATFAPGAHRRSHPNLQHLSLAPLTPRYPIDPADYEAYFDPYTSELHTSTSISQIAGLPSPGGILTNSPARSRASSRAPAGRLRRKNKSNVSIRLPGDNYSDDKENTGYEGAGPQPPSGALTSEGFGHKKSIIRLSAPHPYPSTSHPTSLLSRDSSSSWLVQTGLHLTESSRETKGQSWIGKRDSSTSLHSFSTARMVGEEDSEPFFYRASVRTPGGHYQSARSFGGSRNNSRPSSRTRRRSRRDLTMTLTSTGTTATTTPRALDDVAPDWADQETRAEQLAASAGGIYEDDEGDERDDDPEFHDADPYGMLNFEEQFDTEDEEEVRREISRYKLGKWMDGVIDVFLQLDEEFPDLEFARTRSHPARSDIGGVIEQIREPDSPEAKENSTGTNDVHEEKLDDRESVQGDVEVPPDASKGLWSDVSWFGRMLVRTVRS